MLKYPTNQHQKIHSCTRLPDSGDFRYDIGRKYISGIQSPMPKSITTHAIISGSNLPPVHQLPAHAIILTMHALNDNDMRLSVKTATLLPPKSTMLYNYRTTIKSLHKHFVASSSRLKLCLKMRSHTLKQ